MARPVYLPAPGRGAYDRRLSRSERDAQHRERLLLAAAELLAEGPATVARIVEHAGVGRSTFYEFFDSPEHLLQHLEQRTLRSLESALERALDEAPTPLERVRAIARNWCGELDARPVEARVALTRRSSTSELLSPAGRLLHQVLERCVQAARQGGMAWFGTADEVSLLAAAAAVEAVSRRHLAGHPINDAQRTVAELVAKLLR
jgi:AcrR family transcriptional regulator